MSPKEILEYYSREDVQESLLSVAKNREVVGVFKNGSYGTRPNVIVYPHDIITMVRSGVIEFHCSIERWSQPMALSSENYVEGRVGWDMIFDIDCENIEHGKIATTVFIDALKKHGIKTPSVKFTGGTGFHIGIPWEAIPEEINYAPTVKMFPELPRKIGLYLKEFVKEKLESALLKKYSIEELAKDANRSIDEITTQEGEAIIDPYKIVDIDPVLISPRHLFRMPYSLNRKTFLVSVPVHPEEVMNFKTEQALPDRIKIMPYLKPSDDKADALVLEAIDWWERRNKQIQRESKRIEIKEAIPEEFFPPCIKNILAGIPDGKKRSVFILINFLRAMRWSWKDIEAKLYSWNEKNPTHLRDSYIKSQLRWHKNQKRDLLPPACGRDGWYESFGVCSPDEYCKKIRNPVAYPIKKMGTKIKSKKRKGR